MPIRRKPPRFPNAAGYIHRTAQQGKVWRSHQQAAIDLWLGSWGENGAGLLLEGGLFTHGLAAANAEKFLSTAPGTFVGSWTHGATDATGDASTAYFQTGIIPSTVGVALDDAIQGYYSDTSDASTYVDMGSEIDATQRFIIYTWASAINYTCAHNPDGDVAAAGTSDGLIFGNRKGTTREAIRRFDGTTSVIATESAADAGTLPTVEIYVGAWNQNGTAANFSDRAYSLWFVMKGATEAQRNTFAIETQTMLEAFDVTFPAS